MKLLHAISGQSSLEPNYFSISTDGMTLISNAHSLVSGEARYENINFWNLLTGDLFRTLNLQHDHIAIGCYEKWLLGIVSNADAIIRCNLETEEQDFILDAAPRCLSLQTSHGNNATPFSMSPFEPIFVCGDFVYQASQAGEIKAYNLLAKPIAQEAGALRLPSEILRWQPEKYPACNSSVLISPDSNMILTQSARTRYGLHHLWDLKTCKLIRTFVATNAIFAECLAVNKLGQVLACGWQSSKIKVWDVYSDNMIFSADGKLPATMSIDGRFLAHCTEDNKIVLRDIENNRNFCLINKNSALVKNIALSPDGKLLATYNQEQTIEIWGNF